MNTIHLMRLTRAELMQRAAASPSTFLSFVQQNSDRLPRIDIEQSVKSHDESLWRSIYGYRKAMPTRNQGTYTPGAFGSGTIYLDAPKQEPDRRTTVVRLTEEQAQAAARGYALASDVARKHGWIEQKEGYAHPVLRLTILKGNMKPMLYVNVGATPCIAHLPNVSDFRNPGDEYAVLMMSAMFDEQFIAHISRWDSAYPVRLKEYHEATHQDVSARGGRQDRGSRSHAA